MAVADYQLGAIHPLTDGNGRTGRILNVLMLAEAGLLRHPLLYLSRSTIETKNEYYRLLRAVTQESAWEKWFPYILTGIERTSLATFRKIAAIRDSRTISRAEGGPFPGVGRTRSSSPSSWTSCGCQRSRMPSASRWALVNSGSRFRSYSRAPAFASVNCSASACPTWTSCDARSASSVNGSSRAGSRR